MKVVFTSSKVVQIALDKTQQRCSLEDVAQRLQGHMAAKFWAMNRTIGTFRVDNTSLDMKEVGGKKKRQQERRIGILRYLVTDEDAVHDSSAQSERKCCN